MQDESTAVAQVGPGSAFGETYGQVLAHYLTTRSEDALYRASLLSEQFVDEGIGPEEIIVLHFTELERVLSTMSYRAQARSIGDAHQFLLEVMINYGVQYKNYLELRMREHVLEAQARAELERQRAEEHARLEALKTEMLEHVAHELRTPLTAAIGTLDLARRQIRSGKVERLEPLIGSARDALERLSRLTGDLVQASRGSLPEMERRYLALDDLLNQACDWATAAAVDKRLEIIRPAQPSGAMILGDSDALLSVFGNLLSNAIRYTPSGGTVTVRSDTAGGFAVVEVADTGIGMSPEVREHIFDRFYRAPVARQQDAQGLGLGLTLVTSLVDVHHGTIEVESAVGEGSTFRVRLPLATVAAASDGAIDGTQREDSGTA